MLKEKDEEEEDEEENEDEEEENEEGKEDEEEENEDEEEQEGVWSKPYCSLTVKVDSKANRYTMWQHYCSASFPISMLRLELGPSLGSSRKAFYH